MCQDPCLEYHFWWLWPTFPYLCALRFAIGTLWTTEVVILTGRSILPAGASNEDTPAVIAMKAELVALRALKATTTPAATTGAGKRACTQQDRLPKIARFRGAARSFRYFQFRGEGETVRELSVSVRAKQEQRAKYNNKCKSNQPSTKTDREAATVCPLLPLLPRGEVIFKTP